MEQKKTTLHVGKQQQSSRKGQRGVTHCHSSAAVTSLNFISLHPLCSVHTFLQQLDDKLHSGLFSSVPVVWPI